MKYLTPPWLLTWLTAMALSGPVLAQEFKVGFVNTDRIFREATTAKAAQAKLEQEFSRREKELTELGNSLKGLAEKFEREAAEVCATYLDAPRKAAVDGTHTVSVDEATSLQAIERNAPDKQVQPGSVTKKEFESTRHGTTTLTAGLDVVTGRIVSPTLEATRTEPEFVEHIAWTVSVDRTGEWVFVVDNLNTHASEGLVKWVAQQCGVEDSLGKKTFAASSNR